MQMQYEHSFFQVKNGLKSTELQHGVFMLKAEITALCAGACSGNVSKPKTAGNEGYIVGHH